MNRSAGLLTGSLLAKEKLADLEIGAPAWHQLPRCASILGDRSFP